MKRLILILCLLAQPVMAKTIHVQALENFSTANPPKQYSVKVLDELVLDENITLQENDILKGKVVDIKNPKRLKRNAMFTFVPEELKSGGKVIELKGYYPAKYTTKLNKGQIAKSAALSVGNHFVKGLSMGYNAIEGAVKNEQDNRLKSGVTNAYEESPISLVEKGEQLDIKTGDDFYFVFKTEEDVKEPNYSYTPKEGEN